MTEDGARRRARLADACLYLIVTLDADPDPVFAAVQAALASRCVDLVQLRDVSQDASSLRHRTERLQALCRTHDCLLLVNDQPDLAADLGCDGAHVGQGDVPVETARAWLGPDRLLGLSTHGPEEIRSARTAPVDYVGLGPCFPTGSKVLGRPPGGGALLARSLPAAGTLPVFPIGGIDPQNVAELAAAGATRAAIGAGVLAASDPAAAARALRAALRPGPPSTQGR